MSDMCSGEGGYQERLGDFRPIVAWPIAERELPFRTETGRLIDND
jgi:hypothetical protein